MINEKKYIDSEKLSKAVKKFLINLIEKGKDLVEITEFNAELQKILDKIPAVSAIEWRDVKYELPLVSDEYIVLIDGADKPTVLNYDADECVWYAEHEGEEIFYRVTHWAELPEAPTVD